MAKSQPATDAAATTCRLCLQERPLRKSHIYPEFLYKALYDESHRYVAVPLDEAARVTEPPKGIYERLLCAECEAHLQRWEDYASGVLFSRESGEVPIDRTATMPRLVFAQIDARKLKLFQLSLIWRASVASRPGFGEVQLGPHEERLRCALLADDPLGDADYPCFVALPTAHQKVIENSILTPFRVRMLGRVGYKSIFAGLQWDWVIGLGVTPDAVDLFAVNTARSEFPVAIMDPRATDQWLRGMVRLIPDKHLRERRR